MPKFTDHLIFNFFLSVLLVAAYLKYPFISTPQFIIFMLFYFAGTTWISPDLDTRSESARRCGIACMPYRKIFKHRGVSHNWFWGTITRATYVMFIIVLVIWIIYGFVQVETLLETIIKYKVEFAVAFSGLFISNLFHILLDAIT